MRPARLLFVALVAVAAFPAAAQATSITSTGSSVTYTASSGDEDRLTLTTSGASLVLTPQDGTDADKAWTLSGCTQDGGTFVVTCVNASTDPITLNVGNENDSANASALSQTVTFNGSTGSDSFTGGNGAEIINGGDDNDSLNGGANNDTLNGDAGSDTLNAGIGNDTLGGGGDADTLNGEDGTDTLNGGDDGDNLNGGANNDTLNGGISADKLDGGSGQDTLDGGTDRDILIGGTEADDLKGGDGFDEVRYTDRAVGSPGVTVTLNDVADDGEASEIDNARSDIEDITGGGGPDKLFGDGEQNFLSGGDGNDELDGGAGFDVLSGDDGDDTLRGRDGNGERLDCAAGSDTAVGDEIDRLTGCEVVDLSADLVADADGDGSSKPADCNDANASIRPGAPDLPDNAVDEDCNGADATNPDRDGDGSPRPADCDDANAAVRPGVTEIRGNKVDEDCDGVANPFAVVSSTVVRNVAAGAVTTFLGLSVKDIPAGAKVKINCTGKGCKGKLKKGKTRTFKKADRSFSLLKDVKNLQLRPGGKLVVTITKKGAVGAVITIAAKLNKLPDSIRRCLPPGAKKAVEC